MSTNLVSSSMPKLTSVSKEPKPRERKTKYRCDNCRKSKLFCSFTLTKEGYWPSRCEKCIQKGLQCSKPTLVSLRRNNKRPLEAYSGESHRLSLQSSHVSPKPLVITKHGFASLDVITPSVAGDQDFPFKEAILLLSLHSILLMAMKDMIDMAVSMLRPHRHNAAREHTEDHMPTLEEAIITFKDLACKVRSNMLALSGSVAFAHAQDALNALVTPYFRPELTWGVDQGSLEATRTTITSFYDSGHFGLVYVLQARLLQAGVPPNQDEIARLLLCKQHFMQEFDELIARGCLSFSFPPQWRQCQMFAPKELVHVTAVAKHILNDRRPDILGRLSFHILSDAGASVIWEHSSQGDPGKAMHFHSDDLGSPVGWPIEAMDSTDILGRTALHIAVRQGSIDSVMTLSKAGANMHRLCLNGLSLLHIAACHGHTNVARHLVYRMHYQECKEQCHTINGLCPDSEVQYLYQLDELDGLGRTPFWYAARGSHFEVMKFLTERVNLKVSSEQYIPVQINTEHMDLNRHSALATVARDGRVDVLKFLFGLRNKTWIPLPEHLMPNEHLLLAYAMQSKNRKCIKLVLSQRRWRFGGPVFDRAIEYADQNLDEPLRDELFRLYKFHEAIQTKNPFTGLTHQVCLDIPGDHTAGLLPFTKHFPHLGQTPDLETYPSNDICEIKRPSSSRTEEAVTRQEDAIDGFAGDL